MKRQTQTTGVRTYFGEDLIALQAEPLKALDAFFRQYGPCIIQGCGASDNEDGTVNIAAGLVALDTADSGVIVMPFAGASGVAFPLYMFAQAEAVERAYDDGEVKPVAYDYTARVSALPPADGAPALVLEGSGQRFVDVVQDGGHRFITDAERAKWNGILQLAKEYADGVAATSSEAALRTATEYTDTREAAILAATDGKDAVTLRTAKEYTDTREAAILAATDGKDAATLRTAKEYTDTREAAILAATDGKDAATLRTAKNYADTVVAALAGAAPETLDTLKELADALGNDPNFATTITNLIAQKLNAADYTAADVLAKLLTVDGNGSGLEADAVANQKSGAALKLWHGAEAEYNAIGTKDTNTLYIVL